MFLANKNPFIILNTGQLKSLKDFVATNSMVPSNYKVLISDDNNDYYHYGDHVNHRFATVERAADFLSVKLVTIIVIMSDETASRLLSEWIPPRKTAFCSYICVQKFYPFL